MNLYITFLNEKFEQIYILEDYKSLLWTERYWDSGDFDITCVPTPEILSALSQSKYVDLCGITRPERQFMEIETLKINTEPIDGNELIIKGHTLDQKLARRVVLRETLLDMDIQEAIKTLIYDSISDDPSRKIADFRVVHSDISSIDVFTYFWGEYVIDAIIELCRSNNIGFYVVFNKETKFVEFHLREGLDRTYTQSDNRIVAFNSGMENLLNANYVRSIVPYKNVCIVVGEPDESGDTLVVEVGSATGENRREVFLRPRIPIGDFTPAEYVELLTQKGLEELGYHLYLEAFDGEIVQDSYIYGKDYNMGDILALADDYGHTGKSRVTEMIYFQDLGGSKIYPTFETVL